MPPNVTAAWLKDRAIGLTRIKYYSLDDGGGRRHVHTKAKPLLHTEVPLKTREEGKKGRERERESLICSEAA